MRTSSSFRREFLQTAYCSPGEEAGIAVWSEIELAYRYTKGQYLRDRLDGKEFDGKFLGSVLEAAAKEFVVAGNIGVPLISVVPALSAAAFVVAEISSFQLETIDCFRPRCRWSSTC